MHFEGCLEAFTYRWLNTHIGNGSRSIETATPHPHRIHTMER